MIILETYLKRLVFNIQNIQIIQNIHIQKPTIVLYNFLRRRFSFDIRIDVCLDASAAGPISGCGGPPGPRYVQDYSQSLGNRLHC